MSDSDGVYDVQTPQYFQREIIGDIQRTDVMCVGYVLSQESPRRELAANEDA